MYTQKKNSEDKEEDIISDISKSVANDIPGYSKKQD